MLSVFTALATKLTDLGLVNAVGGTALGVGVVFIFPSIMFYIIVRDDKDASFALKFESICIVSVPNACGYNNRYNRCYRSVD